MIRSSFLSSSYNFKWSVSAGYNAFKKKNKKKNHIYIFLENIILDPMSKTLPFMYSCVFSPPYTSKNTDAHPHPDCPNKDARWGCIWVTLSLSKDLPLTGESSYTAINPSKWQIPFLCTGKRTFFPLLRRFVDVFCSFAASWSFDAKETKMGGNAS